MQHSITYNLFRSRHDCTVICAVPQDRPIPSFIEATAWMYDSTVWDTGVVPPEFLPLAARSSGDLNGFYLFYLRRRKMPAARKTRGRQAKRLAAIVPIVTGCAVAPRATETKPATSRPAG